MATLLTGPDPAQAVWPVPLVPTKALTRPSGYSLVGTEPGLLSDNNSATYNQQQNANTYWRYQVSSITLPFGARVVSVTPSVTARLAATNARNSWLVFQGDHSGAKYAMVDHLPVAKYPLSSAPVRPFSGPSVNSLANGQLITQADLERGLFVGFGLNTIYGTSTANPLARVTEAKLQLAYDMAPTAVLTGPTPGGTINDTASPTITWDYTDDFQPQAAYSLTLTNSAGVLSYSSGKVSSSDTSHAVAVNLPNDTYTVSLRVYQAWNGPGGAFPSLAAVTSTFTVSVLKLGVPTIAAAVTVEQVKITVTPNVNLLNYDDSTFDRGALTLASGNTNCTVTAATSPVLNGTGSAKVTVTATATATVTGRPGAVACQPLDLHNALIYVNPVALTGRSAQLKLNYRNAAGAVLSTATGTVTALPANTWTPLTIVNATAPLLATAVDYAVTFTGTSAADALYLDNAAIWHGGVGTRTNLLVNPRLGNGTTGYAAVGNSTPTIAVVSGDSVTANGNALKVTATGTNVFFPGVVGGAAVTTVPGATYTASCYVKLPTAGAVSSVYGVVNGQSVFTTTNTITDKDVWARATVTFTAAGTTSSVTWCFGGNDVVTGQYFLLSAFLFEQTGTALSYFDGSSPAAAWSGTADQSTSTITTSFPVWSRGGFYEATPNVLSYDDSTLEGDGWTWAPTPDANTTVAVSAAQSTHGARSLVVSRTVASVSVNYAAATAGAASRYQCTPGETLRGFFAARAGSTGRTVQLNIDFYNDAGASVAMPGGSTTTVATTTDVSTGWVTATGTILVPALATGFRVSVLALVAGGVAFPISELHYFDAISVYRSAYDIGFTPGTLPNTDESPVAVVEYTDGTVWYELGRSSSGQGDVTEVFYDYTARSGVARRYRAYMTETENDTDLTSDYSSSATATVALRGVWLATSADPVGTSHQFFNDGAGRQHSIGAQPDLYPIEGRDYQFAEFGTGYDQALQVILQLTEAVDRFALLTVALAKSEALLRDQRGRSIRGVMGLVEFTDEVWGQTARFTFQATGVQP